MAARLKEENVKEKIMKEELLNITNINYRRRRRYVGGEKKKMLNVRERRVREMRGRERKVNTTPSSFLSRRLNRAR